METNALQLQTGDILHCTGKGILARAIMKFTKSQFSHTAVFVRVWGQDYVIDAQSSGVNLRPFEAWQKKFNYKYKVTRVPNVDEKPFALHALSKAGVTAYDFVSLIIKQPWSLITGNWRTERKDPTKKMYCSEYVAWCHNIEHFNRMNPKNVWSFCIDNKHEIIK